jgi:hypothetical protein
MNIQSSPRSMQQKRLQWGNCFVWAICFWFNNRRDGWKVAFTRSRHGDYKHYMVIRADQILHLRSGRQNQVCYPFWWQGWVEETSLQALRATRNDIAIFTWKHLLSNLGLLGLAFSIRSCARRYKAFLKKISRRSGLRQIC